MKKETITFRPKPENLSKLEKALKAKMKKESRPSMSNTVEVALLEYFKIN